MNKGYNTLRQCMYPPHKHITTNSWSPESQMSGFTKTVKLNFKLINCMTAFPQNPAVSLD